MPHKPSLSVRESLVSPSPPPEIVYEKNVILPTQARDSRPFPQVAPRATPSGQPSVKADYPSLGLEVYTSLSIVGMSVPRSTV